MPLPDVYDMEYDQNRLGRTLLANQGADRGIARGANRLGMLLGGGYRGGGQDAFLKGQVEGATASEKMATAQLLRNKLVAQASFAQQLEDSGVPHAQAQMYASGLQGGYNIHELASARNIDDLMARRAKAIEVGTDPAVADVTTRMQNMAPYLAGMKGEVPMMFRSSGGVTTNQLTGGTTLDPLGSEHAKLYQAQTGLEGLRGETERQRAEAEKALTALRNAKSGAVGPGGIGRTALTTEQMKGGLSSVDDKGVPHIDPDKVQAFNQFRAERRDSDPTLANATNALEAFQSQYGTAPGQPGEEGDERDLPPGAFGIESVTTPEDFEAGANLMRRYPPPRAAPASNPTPGVATPPVSTQPPSFRPISTARPQHDLPNVFGDAMTAQPFSAYR